MGFLIDSRPVLVSLLAQASPRQPKVAQESKKSYKNRFKTTKKRPNNKKTGRGGGWVGVWETSRKSDINYIPIEKTEREHDIKKWVFKLTQGPPPGHLAAKATTINWARAAVRS
jgi:hypothetical protein